MTVKNINDPNPCGALRLNNNSGSSVNTGSSVYPNPAKESFTISSSGSDYKLYNNQGNEVKSGKLTDEKTIVNTKELKKGLYFLHITNGNKTEKQQIIIE